MRVLFEDLKTLRKTAFLFGFWFTLGVSAAAGGLYVVAKACLIFMGDDQL